MCWDVKGDQPMQCKGSGPPSLHQQPPPSLPVSRKGAQVWALTGRKEGQHSESSRSYGPALFLVPSICQPSLIKGPNL